MTKKEDKREWKPVTNISSEKEIATNLIETMRSYIDNKMECTNI